MTTEVSIVPQVPMEGVQTANRDLGELTVALADYEKEARALTVESPEQYASAGALLLKVRDVKKKAKYIMTPLKSIAQTIANTFRTMELTPLNKCEAIEMVIENKMNEQKARERAAAQAEQTRINEENRRKVAEAAEERRKADEQLAEQRRKETEKHIKEMERAGELKKREAEKLRKENEEAARREKAEAAELAAIAKENVQEVKVLESTPKVSGLRQRVNWKFRIKDASKVTRGFLVPDETLIGQTVRNLKDKHRAEELIGGIEVYTEDAV